jgi:hypothetical protein
MRRLGRPTKEAMRAVVDADILALEWTEAAQRIELELRAAAHDAGQSDRGRKRRAGRRRRPTAAHGHSADVRGLRQAAPRPMHAGTAEPEPCPGMSEAEIHEHPECTDPTAPPPRRLVCDCKPVALFALSVDGA